MRLAAGTQGTLRSWLTAGAAAAKARPCGGAGARAATAAALAAGACAQQSSQPEERAACGAASAAGPQACAAEPAQSAGAGGPGGPPEAQRSGWQAGRRLSSKGPGKRKGTMGAAGGQRSMRAFLAAPKQAPPASGAGATQTGSMAAAAAGPGEPCEDRCGGGLAIPALGSGGGASLGCLQASPGGSQASTGALAGGRAMGGAGPGLNPGMGAGPNPGLSPRCTSGQAGAVGRAEAAAAWRNIQQRMQPPLCAGHGEPCVIRQVKKAGPNKGAQVAFCMNTNKHRLACALYVGLMDASYPRLLTYCITACPGPEAHVLCGGSASL